jgi:hypothetical protein
MMADAKRTPARHAAHDDAERIHERFAETLAGTPGSDGR